MRKKFIMPINIMKRILRDEGAENVSLESAEALSKVIEEKSRQLAKKAVELTRYNKRKTVKARDIELANKM